MMNRIVSVEVVNRSLQPASAEVWLTVTPERLTETTEVRGRLTGPRCPYASTIEIAYPFRLLRPEQQVPGSLRGRVSIPEASLWDPQSPFLYGGTLELWQDGRPCDQVRIQHGLRQFALTARGLAVNGKVVPLVGRRLLASTAETALSEFRQRGVNLLLVAPDIGAEGWERADRLGFLMLGEVRDASPATLDVVRPLSRRPCCLGWVAPGELHAALSAAALGTWLGVPAETAILPATTPRFVLGRAGSRAVSPLGHLPWIYEGEATADGITLGSVLAD